MKYVIMFTFDPELDAQVPEDRMQGLYKRAYQWYGENAAQIADGGAQLQPVETATTVKYGESGTVLVDGPFSEAKEVVGGFCAETGGAITLIVSTALGIPVSTTHTITGAIVGVGSAQKMSAVRWGVAGNIVWAWIFTIPASAFVAAVAWWIGHHIM